MKSKQKFHHGDLVFVKVVSPGMNHFDTNFYGIVEGSYGDLYGLKGTGGGYAIFKLNKAQNKIVGGSSWYNAADLTLMHLATETTFKLIREYNYS